jgi:hypothetical protein
MKELLSRKSSEHIENRVDQQVLSFPMTKGIDFFLFKFSIYKILDLKHNALNGKCEVHLIKQYEVIDKTTISKNR